MQYRFMKCLAEQHRNISVVGDDDQSIYSWRGAVGDIFALFEKDFAPVYEVRLEQNYRSTGNILAAANAVQFCTRYFQNISRIPVDHSRKPRLG